MAGEIFQARLKSVFEELHLKQESSSSPDINTLLSELKYATQAYNNLADTNSEKQEFFAYKAKSEVHAALSEALMISAYRGSDFNEVVQTGIDFLKRLGTQVRDLPRSATYDSGELFNAAAFDAISLLYLYLMQCRASSQAFHLHEQIHQDDSELPF